MKAEELSIKFSNLIGDSLLTACVLVYIGPLSKQYREAVIDDCVALIDTLHLPRSTDVNSVELLSDTVTRRLWSANGLPSDSFSMESAGVVLKSKSWPLIIDPQVR